MKTIVKKQREERDKLLFIEYQERHSHAKAVLYRDSKPIKNGLGMTMPELTGETYIFNRMKEKEKAKKVTLIYFWSASCQQCEQSVAKLKEMQAIFQNQIAIYTIHMPRTKQDHQLNEVENKIKKLDIPFPVYVDNEFQLTNSFDNRIVPALIFFVWNAILICNSTDFSNYTICKLTVLPSFTDFFSSSMLKQDQR